MSKIVAGVGIPPLEGYFLDPWLTEAPGALVLKLHWARKESSVFRDLKLWLLHATLMHADVVLLPLYIPAQLAFPRLRTTRVEPFRRRHSKFTLILEEGSISLSFIHAAYVEEIRESRLHAPPA